jgi:hypothetical protein
MKWTRESPLAVMKPLIDFYSKAQTRCLENGRVRTCGRVHL